MDDWSPLRRTGRQSHPAKVSSCTSLVTTSSARRTSSARSTQSFCYSCTHGKLFQSQRVHRAELKMACPAERGASENSTTVQENSTSSGLKLKPGLMSSWCIGVGMQQSCWRRDAISWAAEGGRRFAPLPVKMLPRPDPEGLRELVRFHPLAEPAQFNVRLVVGGWAGSRRDQRAGRQPPVTI